MATAEAAGTLQGIAAGGAGEPGAAGAGLPPVLTAPAALIFVSARWLLGL